MNNTHYCRPAAPLSPNCQLFPSFSCSWEHRWRTMPISFAPRPPQGGQRSQDLSSKAATESLPLVLVDEQEICQRERNICWRWTRVVASSSKFLPSSRELVLLPRCVMKREIPVWNKSDLHSAGVMICVDWPHSPACKKFRFSRASKQEAEEGSQGFGLSDPHLLGPQVDGAPVS